MISFDLCIFAFDLRFVMRHPTLRIFNHNESEVNRRGVISDSRNPTMISLTPRIAATLAILASAATAFAPASSGIRTAISSSSSTTGLCMGASDREMPEKVLVIGPSLLQLVVAKALKARGSDVLLVCPNDKKERFTEYIQNGLDEDADEAGVEIMEGALFGLPEESDPVGFGWREGITSVVVCAEDPVVGGGVIDTVMNWDGFGNDRDTYVNGPKKAVLCVPLASKINKEKKANWIPIFNLSQKDEDKIWETLVTDWKENPYISGDKGECESTIIRFGSLLGGGPDGPMQLEPLGINERCYKMSLEQYRDLRERSFDRYRLAAQILEGDAVNKKPESQEEKEKNIKGEEKEAFQASMGYPEQDRTNRHTLAQAICETLRRPVRKAGEATDNGSVPSEFTVLSKSLSALPSEEEWDNLFANPGPASWPDPASFVMPVLDEAS